MNCILMGVGSNVIHLYNSILSFCVEMKLSFHCAVIPDQSSVACDDMGERGAGAKPRDRSLCLRLSLQRGAGPHSLGQGPDVYPGTVGDYIVWEVYRTAHIQ